MKSQASRMFSRTASALALTAMLAGQASAALCPMGVDVEGDGQAGVHAHDSSGDPSGQDGHAHHGAPGGEPPPPDGGSTEAPTDVDCHLLMNCSTVAAGDAPAVPVWVAAPPLSALAHALPSLRSAPVELDLPPPRRI